DVGVFAARTPGPAGKVTGIIVNFACHSTVVGGDQFSPDYAGYLRKHLQAHFGSAIPVVFLLGPCGDITQVDNLSAHTQFGPDYADMMGMQLAGEAARVIRRMQWLKEGKVGAAMEMVMLSIRPEPDADRERPPFGLGSDNSKEQKVEA